MIRNTNLWAIGLMLSIFVFSCKKEGVRNAPLYILVVNASPNSGSIDFQQNLRSKGLFNYLTEISPTLNYVLADSGFNNYKLKKGTEEIASWLYTNEGQHVSFFVCDTLLPAKAGYFFLNDKLDTTGFGKKSAIRLVQLSPDIGAVDLLTNSLVNPAQDSVLIGNKDYAAKFTQPVLISSSGFQQFFGDTSVNIKIRKAASSSIVKQYRVTVKKGKIYSFVLKGYEARTGKDSLSLAIIQHN